MSHRVLARVRLVENREVQPVVDDAHGDLSAAGEVSGEQHAGEPLVELPADGASQRSGTGLRSVAAVGEPVDGPLVDRQGDTHTAQPLVGLLEQQLGDLPQLGAVEAAEEDDLVDAVEELGAEVPRDGSYERLPAARRDGRMRWR